MNRTAAAPSLSEALGLDEQSQPAGHFRLAQERDHRDRVGGGDERAEDERRFDPPAEKMEEPARHHPGAEADAERRQRDDEDEIALQRAPMDIERRLEQERRQDAVEDEVVRQRQSRIDAEQRQRRPCEHQPHRIGQPQPTRRERDQDGEAEQAERANEQDVHGAPCLAALARKGNRAAPLLPLPGQGAPSGVRKNARLATGYGAG